MVDEHQAGEGEIWLIVPSKRGEVSAVCGGSEGLEQRGSQDILWEQGEQL